MEYQKNDKFVRQYTKSKFRTKNWVEISDELRGKCNTNSQIKVKTSMLKSGLWDYAYIAVKATITVQNTGTAAAPNKRQKEVVLCTIQL